MNRSRREGVTQDQRRRGRGDRRRDAPYADDEVDLVIVGAGAGGVVLAHRMRTPGG